MQWYRLRLAKVRDLIILTLIKEFKNYEDIFKKDKKFLHLNLGISYEEINKIYDSQNIDLDHELKLLADKKTKLLFILDEEYPEYLKNIAQPPIFLYYMGDINLLKNKKMSVVGTRKATVYGKICCEKIVRGLVENGITTVSGLATGIDGICHETTLNLDGKTIAVVGSGLDVVYPKKNYSLWCDIAKKGLILSEYSLGTPPFGYNFPQRNRIIVGLSRGVVVVESKSKGGSLITANLALDEGRDVFAVPGDIFSPFSEGSNDLIKKSYAKLTTDVEDILVEYNWNKKKNLSKNKLNLTDEELKIYNSLVVEKNLDEIIEETSMSASDILVVLMELEMKKIVASVPGGKYRRKI